MRIAIVYDCLFPNTVGGAERWYRSLAERLQANGHAVTYVTRRQWEGEDAGAPFPAIAVSGPTPLYTESGRRRLDEALQFGFGVFWHLLRRGGDYDVVHTASFPYFSVIGAWLALRLRGIARRGQRPQLIVDWHELWSRGYWIRYLGRIGGGVGYWVQLLCTRLPDRSFTFSELYRRRLIEEGHRAPVKRLPGEYDGSSKPADDGEVDRVLVVFAGRHIREKRVAAIPAVIAEARKTHPDLHCVILGDGPERALVEAEVRRLRLADAVDVRGRVSEAEVDRQLARAACMLLPSEREGYGQVVIEAISHGTPAVLVAGPDNAATELLEEGVNGVVVDDAEPATLARALTTVIDSGEQLRHTARTWFAEHGPEISINRSLDVVEQVYGGRRPAFKT